ncbi:MAG: LTA synthase family protein, partial [Planctomycetota bacterium]
GRSVGALGYQPDYTPNLTRMCEQGMYFENMFAIGYRTNKGLTGLLCSHPDVGGQNLMKRPEAIGRYRTLPVVMAEKGYRTMFFYGGDPEFDNMREFLEQGGMQEMYCQDTMHSGPRGGFGYSWQDEVVFDKTHEVLSQVPSDERFFAVVLTLSNHDPWDVPSGRTPVVSAGEDNPMGRMKNSYRYADWALNRFFEKARETNAPYLQNTLFVLVADHGQQAELNRTKMLDAPGFRIPCLFYAPGMPGLVQRQRISTVCSQIDLAPTLLSFLGGRYEHSFLGRNVLSIAPGDGFAMLRDFEPLGFVRGDKLVIRPPRSWPRLYRLDRTSMKELELSGDNSKLVDALDKDMLSYYGLARYLLGKKAFAAPAAELLAGFEESSSSAKDHHGPVYP